MAYGFPFCGQCALNGCCEIQMRYASADSVIQDEYCNPNRCGHYEPDFDDDEDYPDREFDGTEEQCI